MASSMGGINTSPAVASASKSNAAQSATSRTAGGGGLMPQTQGGQTDPMQALTQLRAQSMSGGQVQDMTGSGLMNNYTPVDMYSTGLAATAPTYGGGPGATPVSGGGVYTPTGGIGSPAAWAATLLQDLGDKATPQDISSIVNWEAREGGNWNNSAHYNPLNTTQQVPGSTVMGGGNSAGVQAYQTWLQGLQATIQTLKNGNYGDILQALASGNGLGGRLAGLGTWSGGGYYSV